jgi:hypothetical protein
MFTIGAFAIIVLVGAITQRTQRGDSDQVELNIKHARQDIRVVVFLLGFILIMLGVIADLLVKQQSH